MNKDLNDHPMENLAEATANVIDDDATNSIIKNTKKIKYICGVVILLLLLLVVIILSAKQEYTASTTYQYGEASKIYTVPATEAIPAKDAVYETIPGKTYALEPGLWIIGEDIDIPNGTYDIEAIDGSGNVIIWSKIGRLKLNNIMGTQDDGFYEKNYNNYKLQQGDVIQTDATIILTGLSTEELVSPAVEAQEAQPEHDTTESVEYIVNERIDFICSEDGQEVECDQLKYADELKEEAKANSDDVTESMIIYSSSGDVSDFYTSDPAICKSNETEIPCTSLRYGDDLLTDLQSPNDNLK